MLRARGMTRELLIVIGEIQDRTGLARSLFQNVRNPDSYEKGQILLDEIFELCIKTTALFYPVEPPKYHR
jgi:hypothetical protein